MDHQGQLAGNAEIDGDLGLDPDLDEFEWGHLHLPSPSTLPSIWEGMNPYVGFDGLFNSIDKLHGGMPLLEYQSVDHYMPGVRSDYLNTGEWVSFDQNENASIDAVLLPEHSMHDIANPVVKDKNSSPDSTIGLNINIPSPLNADESNFANMNSPHDSGNAGYESHGNSVSRCNVDVDVITPNPMSNNLIETTERKGVLDELRHARPVWHRNSLRQTESEIYDQLSPLFNMQQSEAANHLGVGLTKFKNLCKRAKVGRWPARKLKSLQAAINTAEEFGINPSDVQLQSVLSRKQLIEQSPSIGLGVDVEKWRATMYKKRFISKRIGKDEPPSQCFEEWSGFDNHTM